MNRFLNHSDTVLIRSDEHEELFVRGSAQTPPSTDADPATNRAGHTWVGKDFPRLWKAPTTSACDRKRMLRLLVRDITAVAGAEPKLLHLQIRWQGGATETIDVRRQPNRAEAIRYTDTFVAKIRSMVEK